MKPFEDIITKAQQERTERLKQSEEHLKQYLETRDPQIVIDFFLSSPYALEENRWIVEVIAKWRREGEHDLLKKLFRLPRGVKKGANDTLNLYGLTVVMVDSLTSQGLSHKEAFERLASSRGFSDVEAVKKAYYKTRKSKRMYQLYVEETEDFYVLTFYNARVSWNGVEIFGTHKWWIPRDQTKGEEVTFKVEGVAVNDEAFQRLCTSLRKTS